MKLKKHCVSDLIRGQRKGVESKTTLSLRKLVKDLTVKSSMFMENARTSKKVFVKNWTLRDALCNRSSRQLLIINRYKVKYARELGLMYTDIYVYHNNSTIPHLQ